jgi:hypothetical protein
MKGMQTGALTGAVTGGALGAVGAVAPTASWGPTAGVPDSIAVTPANFGAGGPPAGAYNPSLEMGPTAAGPGVAGPVAATPTAAQGTGGLLSKGGWIERNPELTSSLLKGVAGAFTPSAGEEQRKMFEKMGANYAGGEGLLQQPDVASTVGLRDPSEAFKAARPVPTASQGSAYGFEWQWDPSQGRIVKVPKAG